jgi:hypothetical protein
MPHSDALKSSDRKNRNSGIAVACLTAELVEEAQKRGNPDMAARIETCFIDLLLDLPKCERAVVLMMAFDAVMREAPAERPPLRLVHSRT